MAMCYPVAHTLIKIATQRFLIKYYAVAKYWLENMAKYAKKATNTNSKQYQNFLVMKEAFVGAVSSAVGRYMQYFVDDPLDCINVRVNNFNIGKSNYVISTTPQTPVTTNNSNNHNNQKNNQDDQHDDNKNNKDIDDADGDQENNLILPSGQGADESKTYIDDHNLQEITNTVGKEESMPVMIDGNDKTSQTKPSIIITEVKPMSIQNYIERGGTLTMDIEKETKPQIEKGTRKANYNKSKMNRNEKATRNRNIKYYAYEQKE